MELKRKIFAAVASSTLVFNAFATAALADTTLVISGNGSNSDSTANITLDRNTTVVQNNNADVYNNVDVDADTGNNDAEDNTGGEVSIDTGDVDSKVNVSNTLNSNSASVDCCEAGDTDVEISGNGTYSNNDVNLTDDNDTSVFQNNYADVTNKVDVDGDTGNNDANDNTGGDVSIDTGDVMTEVSISTVANANSAMIGGGNGDGGSLSIKVLGNGSNSDNTVNLTLDNDVLVDQSNNADVYNDVDVDGDTGRNDAEDNTGGEVMIETGDVDTTVEVDNAVNFNFAQVECDCLLDDVLAKISGNGTDSDNDINATLGGGQEIFQGNCDYAQGLWLETVYESECEVDNKVDVDGDTGNNDGNDNTVGDEEGDPSIDTGDANTEVDLNNSGNVNVFGDDSNFPEFDLDLDLSLDLGDLLDWLLGHA